MKSYRSHRRHYGAFSRVWWQEDMKATLKTLLETIAFLVMIAFVLAILGAR